MKLTKSRASLAIFAPRGIRVMRQELLAENGPAPTGEGLIDALRHEMLSHIQDEIDAATHELKAVQEDLLRGDSDSAMATLGRVLAELDSLHQRASNPESQPSDESTARQSSDKWTVAGGVAESTAGYASAAADDDGHRFGSVLVLDSHGDELASELAAAGFEINHVAENLVVLYELSRQQKPDAVLLSSVETTPEGQATVRLIRNCSQHREVPIVFAGERAEADSVTAHADPSAITRQLRSAIDQLVAVS